MSQLGQQIFQARKNKGISQEELAEISKINLRTLQRIEKGETSPHGDTLRRISEALNIPIQDLINYGFVEDIGYIKAMHFSGLIFVLLPIGNIILPAILWLVKKDQIKDISYYAKKLINFQITWSIITYVPFAISIFSWTAAEKLIPRFIAKSEFISWYFPFILYLVNFLYIVIAGILIKNNRRNFSPVSIPFLR
ncbi:MAG: helix-turn-helix domain-containing protein [Bacteroidetes bacterium]|nr:helix-turn-helix domain-containing protein [Bacteroidota bacterium]